MIIVVRKLTAEINCSTILGAKRLSEDIQMMQGKKPTWLLVLTWKYLSPCLIMVKIFKKHLFYLSILFKKYLENKKEFIVSKIIRVGNSIPG